MGSEDRAVREKQLEVAKAEFEAFKGTLKEKGLDEKKARKDIVFRELQAKVKKARKRITAIDAQIAHVEAMKAKETKAESTGKPKKKAPVADDGGKKKAKTKAKGSKKK